MVQTTIWIVVIWQGHRYTL